MNPIAPGAMIKFGWETFKKRPWFFVAVGLIIGIFSSNFSYQTNQVPQITPQLALLVLIAIVIGAVIQTLVKMGAVQIALRAHENTENLTFWDLWAPHPFWRFLGATILYGLVVAAGLILFIIPGIIWSLRYTFVPYLVMDRNMPILDAFKESSRITYGHKWQLLGLFIVLGLVNILGAIALFVGLLVSIPVTLLTVAHVYRTLEHAASEVATPASV